MKQAKLISVVTLGLILSLCSFVFADNESSFEIKPYGYIKLDGSYDQNLTSHGNFVMWVNTPNYEGNDEQFNMTANQTRMGLSMTGKGYDGFDLGGKIEFDLYGSVSGGTIAENKAMLMLRHAYFTIQKGQLKLLAGQSWDIISPLNPSTLNYPVLWACGNFGYRRPQVSLWVSPKMGDNTNLTFAGGFFRTIGSDLTPSITLSLDDSTEVTDGSDDGTDAGIPSIQGIIDINHNLSSNSSIRFGVSGLWGQLKAETNKAHKETYESWTVVGHLAVNFNANFGFAGEYFTGSNLQSYLGGILQNSTLEGVNTQGAWVAAWVKANKKTTFNAGYGFDDPDNNDITSGRSKNSSVFGNIQYKLASKVTIGLEISNWQTEYMAADKSVETYDNLRAQTSFILGF